MSFKNDENSVTDNLDDWFNELDDKMIDLIETKQDIIKNKPNEDTSTAPITEEINNSEMECICIEDTISKNIESLTSNELIQCECSVAYFIQVLIEGSNINKIKSLKSYDNDLTKDKISDIITYLKWISKSCEILAKRIGQEILTYTPTNMQEKPVIIRSSYNFCTKYTQCKNFYSKHEAPICREHHYVHSLLKYDIDSVVDFLEYIVEFDHEMDKEDFNNLYLSIKTICFVTRHMSKEISHIDYITKNNSENYHRNNPIDLKKKKNLTKQNDKPNTIQYKQIYIPHREPSTNQSKSAYSTNKPSYNQNKQYGEKTRATQSYNKFNNDKFNSFKKTNNIVINKPETPVVEKNINRYSVLSEF